MFIETGMKLEMKIISSTNFKLNDESDFQQVIVFSIDILEEIETCKKEVYENVGKVILHKHILNVFQSDFQQVIEVSVDELNEIEM